MLLVMIYVRQRPISFMLRGICFGCMHYKTSNVFRLCLHLKLTTICEIQYGQMPHTLKV